MTLVEVANKMFMALTGIQVIAEEQVNDIALWTDLMATEKMELAR